MMEQQQQQVQQQEIQDSAQAPDQVPVDSVEAAEDGSMPPETAQEEQVLAPLQGDDQADEQQPGAADEETAPADERNAVEAPADQPAEGEAEQ